MQTSKIEANIKKRVKNGPLQLQTYFVTTFDFILVSIKNKYSSISKISCVVPQGSILDPLLFLIYINDIKQAVSSDQLLYADAVALSFNINKSPKLKHT